MKDVDAFLRVIGGFEFCENAADERGSRPDFRFAERPDVGCRRGGVSGTVGCMAVILK
ncbi:hypothetical protein [Alistipes finegoldii]|uniref:hypothetical protein n=1 Tax=Alistipes finegoldii TaxID=214856 RepID=UPI002666658B|nr:hypothetical protein [Alistipes finegoldii]